MKPVRNISRDHPDLVYIVFGGTSRHPFAFFENVIITCPHIYQLFPQSATQNGSVSWTSRPHYQPWHILGWPHRNAGLQSQPQPGYHPPLQVIPWKIRSTHNLQGFVRNSMEYSSTRWAESSASHLLLPQIVEAKALNITSISCTKYIHSHYTPVCGLHYYY